MQETQRQKGRAFRQFVKHNAKDLAVVEDGDLRLVSYERDGALDYDLYKEVQTRGNKYKLDWQWVPERHIKALSAYMIDLGVKPKFGLCHGTRQGFEQAWFRKTLPGAPEVIGTEISDTATDFPDTIEWDFHQTKPEWLGATDFIYSNSWDHSYDPRLCFDGWISCLSPGGVMLLDHSRDYMPDQISTLDPCGISEEGLVKLLNGTFGDQGQVLEVIEGGRRRKEIIRTVVYQKHPAQA